MKYIYSDSSADRRAIATVAYTLVAAGINAAIIVAVHGLGTILNSGFSSVSPLLESVCTRFC